MTPYKHLLMACVLLAACDGNPFLVETDPGTDPDTDTGVGRDRAVPPGTVSPTRDSSIFRREEKTPEGNGFAESISYDAEEDTFSVDGLAFDGGNVYQRGDQVGSLGPFAVYEADSTYADDVTGAQINQFSYRALYGVSDTGDTKFAIVRTGAYAGYGYGGFVYQREGGVTLPVTGQANYRGQYAGLRDFDGASGLEYTTGVMSLDIDFEDFNASTGVYPGGVKGTVTSRAIFDVAGNDITENVIQALEAEFETSLETLPVLRFAVGPGVLDGNGEIVGVANSDIATADGLESYEAGNYYAVIAGDATQGGDDTVVGVIVVETDDPRFGGATVRETGGFLLYRDPD